MPGGELSIDDCRCLDERLGCRESACCRLTVSWFGVLLRRCGCGDGGRILLCVFIVDAVEDDDVVDGVGDGEAAAEDVEDGEVDVEAGVGVEDVDDGVGCDVAEDAASAAMKPVYGSTTCGRTEGRACP